MKKIEWPPGSGRVAEYEPHELDDIRALNKQHERGEITDAELQRQVALIHDLKVELGARILKATQREGGPFQIPDSVAIQLDIDQAAPRVVENRPGPSHAHGPVTERIAKMRNYPRSGSQRWRVLEALAAAGERGRTDYELEVELELLRPSPGNRRAELVEDGLVLNAGETRPTSTGAPAIVWRLTDFGLEVYEHLRKAA
jgi:hypothetical protein